MDVEAGNAPVETLPAARRAVWRHFLIRDGITFLSLTAVSLLLGAVTTFLFRSFQSHRDDLAVQWAQRGTESLGHGQAKEAVTAFRTSLAYRPEDRDTQLALARALAASGHTAEAENYFESLWQAQPGDGLINLQLARLERTRGDAVAAINYYRAAVFGTWAGDAPVRRRDARLELSSYLIERGELQAARAELLIAAGNNPDADSQLTIGEMLEQANDPRDAMTAYRNAMQGSAVSQTAQAKAGELCYRMGGYTCAADLLEKALHYKGWTAEQITRITALHDDAIRLQELSFAREIQQPFRTEHLLRDARLAEARAKTCLRETPASTASLSATLHGIQARWNDLDSPRNRNALRSNEELQEAFATLITDTENAANQLCGAPTADDALLMYLHAHPMTNFGAGNG